MKINSEKFQCIVFGNVDDPGEFTIDNQSIVPTKCVKLDKLIFGEHTSYISQNASKILLYNSFVECYFNYCCTLWHFCSNSETFKIEKNTKTCTSLCFT
jgi:hypothetical protein